MLDLLPREIKHCSKSLVWIRLGKFLRTHKLNYFFAGKLPDQRIAGVVRKSAARKERRNKKDARNDLVSYWFDSGVAVAGFLSRFTICQFESFSFNSTDVQHDEAKCPEAHLAQRIRCGRQFGGHIPLHRIRVIQGVHNVRNSLEHPRYCPLNVPITFVLCPSLIGRDRRRRREVRKSAAAYCQQSGDQLLVFEYPLEAERPKDAIAKPVRAGLRCVEQATCPQAEQSKREQGPACPSHPNSVLAEELPNLFRRVGPSHPAKLSVRNPLDKLPACAVHILRRAA